MLTGFLSLGAFAQTYDAQIAACTPQIQQFSKDTESLTFGFTPELKSILDLKLKSSKSSAKDNTINVQILGDNMQLSVSSPLDFEDYEKIRSNLKQSGLEVIYENNEVRNTPDLSRSSKITIFKKPNFNYQAEQSKLNNFLSGVDKVYTDTAQCYSAIFKDASIEVKKQHRYLGIELLKWKLTQQSRGGSYFNINK